MKKSDIPRYIQIQNYINEQINSGNWKEGDLLPTELELSKMFEVSRITVTTALREMVKDGIIYRIQGKGTYVARPKFEMDLYKLANLSIVESLDSIMASSSHKNIIVRTAIPSPKIAAILKLDEGKKVVTFEKLKYINGIPFSFELFHLPEDMYPGILEKNLENMNLLDIITKEYNFTFEKNIVYFEPVLSDKKASKLLETPVGSPMLCAVMELYDSYDQPIGCVELLCRGDQAKYVIRYNKKMS